MSHIVVLLVVVLITACIAHQQFQSRIPNGHSVPDPCKTGSIWEGVGHEFKGGKSKRNPFGKDFQKNGNKWSKELCQKDSDEDGRTNGVELGDPDCTWTPGKQPRSPSLSHPGICEPLDNDRCKEVNKWLTCNIAANYEMGQFCPDINKNHTVSRDLRMSPTLVPDKETTYFCQMFDLNLTRDHHMVATQPLVTASSVVHHLLLFGCNPKVSLENVTRSPYECDMVPHQHCNSLIGAWTIGSPGECAHPEMGFRIGPNGYRTVALQVHWNNAKRDSDLVDNSGLKVFLTSALRKHDAGMLVIGQNFLQVDPRQGEDNSDFEFSSTCPERCTKVMIYQPIYITSAVNHMHYLGKGQSIKVFKNNTLLNVITEQDDYKYDDPHIYNFPKPIQVNPGDELRTTCVFRRTTSPNPVCWGEATSDEMCFGFITYFPLLKHLSHPWCTSHRSIPSCDRHLPGRKTTPIDGCNWWEFRNVSDPETQRMMAGVEKACFGHGHKLHCSDTCKNLTAAIASHPCLKGDIGSYMLEKFRSATEQVYNIVDAVVTCSCVSLPYCDRKFPHTELGLRQPQFCSTSASSSYQTTAQPKSASPTLRWPCTAIILFSQLIYVNFAFSSL